MPTKKTITRPAIAYIRMATDKQDESPDRQKAEINKLAERKDYRITHWYSDLGMTGTESVSAA